jgi:hypothetical protein
MKQLGRSVVCRFTAWEVRVLRRIRVIQTRSEGGPGRRQERAGWGSPVGSGDASASANELTALAKMELSNAVHRLVAGREPPDLAFKAATLDRSVTASPGYAAFRAS